MDWARRSKLIARWALVLGVVTALFWVIWSLMAEVPVISEIKIAEDLSYPLPFNISRWWDVLAVPIWSTVLILFFTSKLAEKSYEKTPEDPILTLFFALALAALILGLIFGLVFGQVFTPVFVLVLAPAFGLVVGLFRGLNFLVKKWPETQAWLLAE